MDKTDELFFKAQSVELAREIRAALAHGENLLITLEGPLGAGKTTFTKALLRELGFDPAQVQSPTFLKLLEYDLPGLGLCLHLDGYRMDEPDDYEKLALESYAERARIWIVEWPELFLKYFAQNPSLPRRLAIGARIEAHIGPDHALRFQVLSDHSF